MTKDKKRLSYFQAVLRILEAGTYSTSGVIIITPDNHEGCSDCLGFGITSGLLIQTYLDTRAAELSKSLGLN